MKKLLSFLFSDKSEKTSGKNKRNLVVVLFLFVVAFLVLIGRFAWLQFAKGKTLKEAAYRQQNSGRELVPVRGTIYDSNGNVLATSLSAVKISVNPRLLVTLSENGSIKLGETRDKIASKLSESLGIRYEEVMAALEKDSSYVLIKSKVDTDIGDDLKSWVKKEKIKGVNIDPSFIRYYPNGSLASHVLGFTGSDDQGLVCGVEVALDDYLAGTPGKILADVDTSGNELPYDAVRRIDEENGYNAVLTIDINMQSIVEKHLKEAVEMYGVEEGACCIVMNPKNADVLAMASYPDFNPNDPYAYPYAANLAIPPEEWEGNTNTGVAYLSGTVWRNKALTDTYEPGSTFKAIVASMLLEEGTVTKDTEVSDLPLKLSGWTIRCWADSDDDDEDLSHGTEDFEHGVINSCNPVFAKMALEMGLEKFYRYVSAFGFTNKTGIMLSGEAESIMHKNPTQIDLAVAAFGQRFQITPIQMGAAYCALANGGTLYTPRIVKYLTDEEGNIVKKFETEAVRQVISKDISEETLGILQKVVAEGTGSNAYVPGFRIAGKTGTSETTETTTTGRYICSFSGIAPADDPELVVLVVFDHPTVGSISGGVIAAPIAADIIEDLLKYMGHDKKYSEDDLKKLTTENYVTGCVGGTVGEALSKLGNTYSHVIVGEDKSYSAEVVDMYPRPGMAMTRESVIFLYTSEDAEREKVIMPDLTGMELKECCDMMHSIGLNVFASRLGKVIWQDIKPGTEVEVGTIVSLALRNDVMEQAGNKVISEE